MRTTPVLAIVAFVCATGAAPSARAAEWCARYDPYTENCGFYTFQQCLDTIRGVGGICERNPRYGFRGPGRVPRYR